jgi:hypothetical protein
MPVYTYKCSSCGFIYKEHRASTDPQFFIKCTKVGCGIGDFEEIPNE